MGMLIMVVSPVFQKGILVWLRVCKVFSSPLIKTGASKAQKFPQKILGKYHFQKF